MSEIDTQNRRQHRRVPASMLPLLTACLSSGPTVKLLDVSRRGVRLETPLPMRRGETVCIRFVAADTTVTLSAAVVRATVAHVESNGIRYEAALSFAGDLVLCDQLYDAAMREPEAQVPESSVTSPSNRSGLDPVVDHTVVVRGVADAPALLAALQASGR